VLIGGASEGGGGTGRRFARLFQHFQSTRSESEVWLITLPGFLELMTQASIEIDPTDHVIEFDDGLAKQGAGPVGKLAGYRDASRRLAHLALEAELDLVHIPIPHLVYAPYLLRPDDGVRQTFSMTAAVGSFEEMNWKAQLLYRIGFECADAIDTLYRDVASRFPSFAGKIHVSPCSFTDSTRFDPATEKKNTIVFAGRLEAFKNPRLFVDAAALAADVLRDHGWTCQLFGDGELRTDIETRITQQGLGDLVAIDRVADLSRFLARSRVFASLQQTENYPSQVLLEAMASGNAIIATDVGDTRRLVDEEVGLLIAQQTPDALCEAIKTLVRDRTLCDRLAQQSRDRIVEHHSVSRFAEYMETFWHAALAQPAPASRPGWPRLCSMALGGALGMRFR